MPLSTFTSVATIGERSEATPGLFNRIFSIVSQNVDQLNVDALSTLTGVSTNTLRPESGSTVSLVPTAVLVANSIQSGSGIFHVRAFGAVGDNVTNDAPSIQSAINRASATAVATNIVLFDAATYRCNSRLSVGNVILRGASVFNTGTPRTLLNFANSTSGLSFLATNSGAGVEGITLQGSGSTGFGVWLGDSVTGPGAGHTVFRDCMIRTFGTGVNIGGGVDNCSFFYCHFDSNTSRHIIIAGGAPTAPTAHYLEHCSFSGSPAIAALELGQSSACGGSHLDFSGGAGGISAISLGAQARNHHFSNIHIEGYGSGVRIIGGAGGSTGHSFNGIEVADSRTTDVPLEIAGGVANCYLNVYGASEGNATSAISISGNVYQVIIVSAASSSAISIASGTTVIVVSAHGNVYVPGGAAIFPTLGFTSEYSLGWFRSGVSTLALSYGSFNINQARTVSMRTLAASSLTPSAANTNTIANECGFVIGGASGASFWINSGGTTYIFNSAISAANA